MKIDPMRWYSIKEVAQYFSASDATIRSWIEDGWLKGFRGTPTSPYQIKGQVILDFENNGGALQPPQKNPA